MYTIENLLERLKKCADIQKQQQEIISELQAENNLLSSTVTNKELGKINEERRNLQQKVFICKSRQRKAEQDLQDFKDEYSEDYNELQERLKDIKQKQRDTQKYIAGEVKKITKAKKSALEKEYKQKKEVLDSKYKENEAALLNKVALLRKTILVLCVAVIILLLIIFLR